MFTRRTVDSALIEFVVCPNCSASWREVKWFFYASLLAAAGISGFFCAWGVWYVLPFSGLEMAILGAALYVCARDTHKCERILLSPEQATVSRSWGPSMSASFQAAWTSVTLVPRPYGRSHQLRLGSHGRGCEIGAFLTEEDRAQLAIALKLALAEIRDEWRPGSFNWARMEPPVCVGTRTDKRNGANGRRSGSAAC